MVHLSVPVSSRVDCQDLQNGRLTADVSTYNNAISALGNAPQLLPWIASPATALCTFRIELLSVFRPSFGSTLPCVCVCVCVLASGYAAACWWLQAHLWQTAVQMFSDLEANSKLCS